MTTNPAGVSPGTDPTGEVASFRPQITAQAIDFLYRNYSGVVIGLLLVPVMCVVVLWDRIGHTLLLGWCAAMILVAAVRLALSRRYRREAPPPEAALRWAHYFTLTALTNGLLWGAAGIMFFVPNSATLQIFLFTTLTGLATGSLMVASYWPMSFYAFAVPVLALSALRLALEGSAAYLGLSILMLMHILILIPLARNMHRAGLTAIRLRFENLDLVESLSAQRDAAERANIAKSKFLAAASHDLRQPLHSLTLFTSALSERISYPEVSRLVKNINDSVRALEKLFNALLDISRLDAGVLQPEIRHFRLDDLHRNLLNDYLPAAADKGLTLVGAPCEVVVRSDPLLLERILRNLLSNAIRYTDRGEVSIRCEIGDDLVRIVVTDTGIGIPVESQREIFNEFTQLGNPERDRAKGLGLGLAIVDRIARLLGHTIDVQSTPGAGSRFAITVPRGDPQRVPPESSAGQGMDQGDVAGLRVLVVDDEISIREGMQALLEQWGCVVTLAGSEEEAVTRVRGVDAVPDAIIADYRLRENRTGAQAIERVRRESGRPIPALIISGDTAAERLREVSASGYQLVHKPVQPAMLRAFLRHARRPPSV